ncbi:hypothetical protein EDD98_7535 [Streptomyces sp. PanSC19]|nr:hypothetical protein EDD98_7535 [Streptomyces sp. PanSC19]
MQRGTSARWHGQQVSHWSSSRPDADGSRGPEGVRQEAGPGRSPAGPCRPSSRSDRAPHDQGAPGSLIVVCGSSNRSKAGRDSTGWLPVPAYRCDYASRWAAGRLRWSPTADPAECDALSRLAEACPGATVTCEQVP